MTGAELKAIRTKLNCTGEVFARVLGYGGSAQGLKTVVYLFESGRRDIPPAIARLAVMLGIHGVPNARWFDGGDIIAEASNQAKPRKRKA
jgi:transcriptional regulator with XRE-family HTH domain